MPSTARSRVYLRVFAPVAVIALLALLWFTGLLATVKPISSAKTLADVMAGGVAFDKVTYVNGIWQSKVIPTVERNSVALDTLLPVLQKNPDEAAKEYGNNVGGADNFLVHVSGIVTGVDTSSMTGSLTVAAAYGGGTHPVKIQIGPIILGTALRDAVKFITFEQFTNQMQYGGVSDELNSRVTKDVLSKIDLKSLMGKHLDIKGAFTYDPSQRGVLLITPVIVKVE